MTVVKKQEYKWLDFAEIPHLVNMPFTFAISPEYKVAYKANYSVDMHQNSYLFQDEAVVTYWSWKYPDIQVLSGPDAEGYCIVKMKVEARADNQGFWRFEGPQPLRQFFNYHNEALFEVNERLRGIK
jgi:hypothetical protein